MGKKSQPTPAEIKRIQEEVDRKMSDSRVIAAVKAAGESSN